MCFTQRAAPLRVATFALHCLSRSVVSVLMMGLLTMGLEYYGVGLFLCVPFLIGAGSSYFFNRRVRLSFLESMGVLIVFHASSAIQKCSGFVVTSTVLLWNFRIN